MVSCHCQERAKGEGKEYDHREILSDLLGHPLFKKNYAVQVSISFSKNQLQCSMEYFLTFFRSLSS